MLSSRGMDPASKFHIGTSGYSFPDWVGPFYPPGTRRQELFAQYVRQFRTVELNYTFYRMQGQELVLTVTVRDGQPAQPANHYPILS